MRSLINWRFSESQGSNLNCLKIVNQGLPARSSGSESPPKILVLDICNFWYANAVGTLTKCVWKEKTFWRLVQSIVSAAPSVNKVWPEAARQPCYSGYLHQHFFRYFSLTNCEFCFRILALSSHSVRPSVRLWTSVTWAFMPIYI